MQTSPCCSSDLRAKSNSRFMRRHEETVSFAVLTGKKGAGQNLNAAGLRLISGQADVAARQLSLTA